MGIGNPFHVFLSQRETKPFYGNWVVFYTWYLSNSRLNICPHELMTLVPKSIIQIYSLLRIMILHFCNYRTWKSCVKKRKQTGQCKVSSSSWYFLGEIWCYLTVLLGKIKILTEWWVKKKPAVLCQSMECRLHIITPASAVEEWNNSNKWMVMIYHD